MTESFELALIGLAAMFALIIFHVPIGVAMLLVGVVGISVFIGFDRALSLVSAETYSAIGSESLAVIAIFLMMGSFATVAGLSADLFRIANAFMGHRKGGLAAATIGGCAGFGAICGSSVATTATMARIAVPEMLRRSYDGGFAAGSVAAGGTLGILIPPSVIMVLYAVLTENSPLALFVAGLVPGLIAVVLYLIAIEWTARRNPKLAPEAEWMPWPERWKVVASGWRAIVVIIGVSVGIYGGIFTVLEAASVGAALTFIFALFSGNLTWKAFAECLKETAGNTCLIFVIVIGANVLGRFLAFTRAPDLIVSGIEAFGWPPLAILLVLMVFYIILGSIFDTVAAMVITLPFTYPLVVGTLGMDPIWWGIVMVMVMEIGMITPPIGINVFVIHGVTRDIPLSRIYSGIVPYLVADFIRLALVVAMPVLAIGLPTLLGYM
ncbi:TRAP transporter large permease [Jannaschia sp. CCS1]|uniref:TRAP transporter large permease n=1 Tax=Jannaschia sp. (strain CCS1) TaxID=290400 RepID=UPI000053D7A7|nr:TRAP transporter large permease [Jannaschia sp. CCS1]ABD56687.1 TRAP C4-dicarboxylate transport system permease DctM subunit [Jannaschia sp. CCS1]